MAIENDLNDWNKINQSLVILERTNNKLQLEYADTYKNWNSENVYRKSISYTDVREQIREKEHNKKDLSDCISDHLTAKYPNISVDTIHQIPLISKLNY